MTASDDLTRQVAVIGLVIGLITNKVCMAVLALWQVPQPVVLPALALTTLGALVWLIHRASSQNPAQEHKHLDALAVAARDSLKLMTDTGAAVREHLTLTHTTQESLASLGRQLATLDQLARDLRASGCLRAAQSDSPSDTAGPGPRRTNSADTLA